jgi:hypothetical protein
MAFQSRRIGHSGYGAVTKERHPQHLYYTIKGAGPTYAGRENLIFFPGDEKFLQKFRLKTLQQLKLSLNLSRICIYRLTNHKKLK